MDIGMPREEASELAQNAFLELMEDAAVSIRKAMPHSRILPNDTMTLWKTDTQVVQEGSWIYFYLSSGWVWPRLIRYGSLPLFPGLLGS